MKNTLIIFAILAFILRSTCYGEHLPAILQDRSTIEFDTKAIASGEYFFRFATSNNDIKRQETGYLDDDGNLVMKGYYSFIDPDGKEHYVAYTADKNGYKTMDELLNKVGYGIPPGVVATLLGK